MQRMFQCIRWVHHLLLLFPLIHRRRPPPPPPPPPPRRPRLLIQVYLINHPQPQLYQHVQRESKEAEVAAEEAGATLCRCCRRRHLRGKEMSKRERNILESKRDRDHEKKKRMESEWGRSPEKKKLKRKILLEKKKNDDEEEDEENQRKNKKTKKRSERCDIVREER